MMKFSAKMILPIFIVMIMIFSSIGFFYTGNNEQTKDINEENIERIEFKGKSFERINGNYRYKGVEFIYSPEELDNASVSVKEVDIKEKVYVSINGTAPQIASKIPFIERIIWASYDNNASLKYNIPLKDCGDANENVTVMKLINKEVNGVISEKSSIRQDGQCYILEGELNLVIERFILEVLENE